MPDQLQLRGGTTTEHNSFTGASKEVTVDTTKKTLVVHDGATQGGIPLMKESGGNAATTVGIGTGGTNAINIDSSQRVGIGTANPATKLHVSGTSGLYTRFQNTSTGNNVNFGQSVGDGIIDVGGSYGLRILTNGSDRLKINSSGKVGIGTASPQVLMHLNDTNARMQFTDSSTGSGSGDGVLLGLNGDDDFFINNRETGKNVLFFTQGSERMRIVSDGNVRIASQHLRFDTSGKGIIFGNFGGNNRPGIFGNYTSSTDNNITFTVTGSERMRVAADGKIGIGVTDPDQKLEVDGIIKGSSYFQGGASATSGNNFHFGAEGDGTFRIYEGNYGAGTERFRINTNGRVGIGATDPSTAQLVVYRGTTNSGNPIFQARSNHDTTNSVKFEIDGDGDAYFSDLVGIGTTNPAGYNANADDIVINRSGNAGLTISTPNSSTGRIAFGDPEDNNIGQIRYAHSENSMIFDVNAGEKMRISANGYVGIATNNPNHKLSIVGSNEEDIVHLSTGNVADHTFGSIRGDNESGIRIRGGGSGRGGEIELAGGYRNTLPGIIRFSTTTGTSFTERMRIAADGTIFLSNNTDTTGGGSAGCYINNSQQQFFRGNQGDYIHFKTATGTGIGRITNISDTSTNYNTSSDYRLKENETAISDGITRLKTLKPYRFNWKSDSTRIVDGFFAHEVTAVPEAVSGTKDAIAVQADVDEGLANNVGDPVYQSIDHSKLVPLLTAALQEAISKIETLETKVAALEAK